MEDKETRFVTVILQIVQTLLAPQSSLFSGARHILGDTTCRRQGFCVLLLIDFNLDLTSFQKPGKPQLNSQLIPLLK